MNSKIEKEFANYEKELKEVNKSLDDYKPKKVKEILGILNRDEKKKLDLWKKKINSLEINLIKHKIIGSENDEHNDEDLQIYCKGIFLDEYKRPYFIWTQYEYVKTSALCYLSIKISNKSLTDLRNLKIEFPKSKELADCKLSDKNNFLFDDSLRKGDDEVSLEFPKKEFDIGYYFDKSKGFSYFALVKEKKIVDNRIMGGFETLLKPITFTSPLQVLLDEKPNKEAINRHAKKLKNFFLEAGNNQIKEIYKEYRETIRELVERRPYGTSFYTLSKEEKDLEDKINRLRKFI